jgi:hypothetical protein
MLHASSFLFPIAPPKKFSFVFFRRLTKRTKNAKQKEKDKKNTKYKNTFIPLYLYTVSPVNWGRKIKKVHELHELPRIKEPQIYIDWKTKDKKIDS